MAKFDDFNEFEFDCIIDNPFGDVLARYIGRENGLEIITWGIQAGTSYLPESHYYHHTLLIVKGNGFISVAGEERPYAPGNVFEIAAYVLHGFAHVYTSTVVIQSQSAAIRRRRP